MLAAPLMMVLLLAAAHCPAYEVITNTAWELRIHCESDSSPAVGADGTIFLGGWRGEFWAVKPDGKRKWIYETGVEIKSSPAVGADGTVYFGSRDRNVYALTGEGKLKWKFRAGGWVDSSPALGADGTVYFGAWDGQFYSLAPTGIQRWSFKTCGPVVSSPAIGADGSIYFGSHDHRFYALAPDGKKRWEFQAGGPVISSPAIGEDGAIYFTSVDGYLYALEADGRLRWRLRTGSVTESSPVIAPTGLIYLGVNIHLWAISPKGEKVWQRLDERMIEATPMVLADDTVVFVSRSGMLKCVRGDDGSDDTKLLWQFYLYGHGSSCPGIGANGTLYISGKWNDFYALATRAPLASGWSKFRGNARNTGNASDRQ